MDEKYNTTTTLSDDDDDDDQELRSEIKEAFDMTAGEGKEYICVSEMKLALNYLGISPKKEDISAMFGEQVSPETKIDLERFQKLAYPRVVARRMDVGETIARAFRLYDRDGKGWITQKDLELVAQQIGEAEDITEDELHEMFAALDTDHDGRVSESDFHELFN